MYAIFLHSGSYACPCFLNFLKMFCNFCRSYEEIENGFAPIMSSRQEQINSEANLRELQWKMYRKERCLSRLAVLDEPGNNEV